MTQSSNDYPTIEISHRLEAAGLSLLRLASLLDVCPGVRPLSPETAPPRTYRTIARDKLTDALEALALLEQLTRAGAPTAARLTLLPTPEGDAGVPLRINP
jgi:hypothetical protein